MLTVFISADTAKILKYPRLFKSENNVLYIIYILYIIYYNLQTKKYIMRFLLIVYITLTITDTNSIIEFATNAGVVFQPTAFLRRNLPVCCLNCNDSCSPSSSSNDIRLSVNNGTRKVNDVTGYTIPTFYGFQTREFAMYLYQLR